MKGGFLANSGIIIIFISLFMTGWISNSVYDNIESLDLEKPFASSIFGLGRPREINSPYDHIKEDQIHVYEDRIVIDLKGASWAEFTDTNSMDPIIDIGANSFEIKPETPENVHKGDIISYRSDYSEGLIVHRIAHIGEDEEGWYCIAKGDNLSEDDPGKIRFEQINGVLVGVIY